MTLFDPNPISILLVITALAALVGAARVALGGLLPDVAGDRERLGAPARPQRRRKRKTKPADNGDSDLFVDFKEADDA